MSDPYLSAAWERGRMIFRKAIDQESPYFGPGQPLSELSALCRAVPFTAQQAQAVMDWLDFKLPAIKIDLGDKVALNDLWQLMLLLYRRLIVSVWMESGGM
jgi:hypothetical protein